MPEWSSAFPYFLQFKSDFGNKEFMIWATVSSLSCFCWLYRASPSLAAENIINLILVLTIWWCPCVESSLMLLEEGVCCDQCVLLAKLYEPLPCYTSILKNKLKKKKKTFCLNLEALVDLMVNIFSPAVVFFPPCNNPFEQKCPLAKSRFVFSLAWSGRVSFYRNISAKTWRKSGHEHILIDSDEKRHSRQGRSKCKSPKKRTHLAYSSDNEKTTGLKQHKQEEGDQIRAKGCQRHHYVEPVKHQKALGFYFK